MTLANDSFLRTADASGTSLATHLVGGKEHPVEMVADAEGHIHGSAPAYLLYQTPRALTTTVIDYFDLFNGTGSGKIVRVRGLWPIIDMPAAAAYTRSYVFDVFRSSTAGASGSVIPYRSATKVAAGFGTIWPLDTNNPAIPAQITARTLPATPGTASDFLWDVPIYAEETNPATALIQGINMVPELAHDQPLTLREGQGIRVRQNTAVAGPAVGWLMAFTLP